MAKPGKNLTLGLILAIALIDAILLAVVRLRYIESHGYDPRPEHRAVARPSPQ